MKLRSPFPYFGGKARAASLIWRAFGDTPNYIEPFAGSLAVLLSRPHAPDIETINDIDGHLVNFYRAVQRAPAEVAAHADWPVTEIDLHARHAWLIEQKKRMAVDPDVFDAKAAGWWLWGICAWVGTGWCQRPSNQLPHLGTAGGGINTKEMRDRVPEIMQALAKRLRRVRIGSGDFERVLSRSVTTNCHGSNGKKRTAVLMDPPYKHESNVYGHDSAGVSERARLWCVEHGGDPMLRIVLCGRDGDYEMPSDWRCVAWTGSRGFSTGEMKGRLKERLWLSPHCLPVEETDGAQEHDDGGRAESDEAR